MKFNILKTLIVLLGPTGVGKIDLSIELAMYYNTSIISCDSRQIYKEMCIGTAVPRREKLEAVPHFFIQTESVHDYFNCWEFEQQALRKIRELFEEREVVVMAGGSMMYIDAVCKGIDEMPTVDEEVRRSVKEMHEREGIEALRLLLKKLDPVSYGTVDLKNAKRIMHALEVCLTTGQPYSSNRVREGAGVRYRENRLEPRPGGVVRPYQSPSGPDGGGRDGSRGPCALPLASLERLEHRGLQGVVRLLRRQVRPGGSHSFDQT